MGTQQWGAPNPKRSSLISLQFSQGLEHILFARGRWIRPIFFGLKSDAPADARYHYIGAPTGTRTPDQRIKSPLLYQLSYRRMVLLTGIEPVTPA